MVFFLLPAFGVVAGGAAVAAVITDVVIYGGLIYWMFRPAHSPQGRAERLRQIEEEASQIVSQSSVKEAAAEAERREHERKVAAARQGQSAQELQKATEDLERARNEAAENLRARQRAEEIFAAVQRQRELAEEEARNYPVPEFLQPVVDRGAIAIAVTGQSGAGKSSLINALRRVRPRQEGWAPQGVTETTLVPKWYRFATSRKLVVQGAQWLRGRMLGGSAAGCDGMHVMLQNMNGGSLDGATVEILEPAGDDTWRARREDGTDVAVSEVNIRGLVASCGMFDLPGCGTDLFPTATYVQMMGLRYFDLVIVVTSCRFTEGESSVIKELKLWSVPYFLVRTGIEKAIKDGWNDSGMNPVEVMQTCRAALVARTGNDDIYFVDSTPDHWEDFDLPQLRLLLNLAVKGSRGVDVERTCPICDEAYQDYGGVAGPREYAEPCGHACCTACWSKIRASRRNACPICCAALAPATHA